MTEEENNKNEKEKRIIMSEIDITLASSPGKLMTVFWFISSISDWKVRGVYLSFFIWALLDI